MAQPEPASRDYRTPFRRNRDRLIHNAAFRRLQGKTQVFLSGEYDFYRTRLTHSIEVAQIAGSIGQFLNHSSAALGPDFHIDPDLCEAIALAHDIGHPPFGHAGEGTLHRLMVPYGGFEGNAQTLRLVGSTIFTSGGDRRGLNPTRAVVDGVLKYKTLWGEVPDQRRHFLYADQQPFLDFVCGGRPWPADLPPGPARNQFRSLECQIMDWADDTAYSLNDVVDGVHAGFISVGRVERWAETHAEPQDRESIHYLAAALRRGDVERALNRRIGRMVEAVTLVERENFLADLSNRWRFGIAVAPDARREQAFYNRIAIDLVFRSPQICQLEHKGGFMLTRLFETLAANYLATGSPRQPLLSADFEREIARADLDERGRARVLCDYLAGMTDGFASRVYKRMFDADFGSIVDLV
ncbi:MAG TPA: dNTP triphosphohydrolase [Candidatus Krumholzibacteria bacterium]|nr:dNTP triphosphohydrolase [Candidatus Krumholzibacteria bacterium]HPD70861.1 dNTP triphosphohydrolase [Candidatus Krumholzibacteria bacterium]HRY39439.1 dNTP triphosphohydrolase [Candidatus Krumholzibacteria bacterium]